VAVASAAEAPHTAVAAPATAPKPALRPSARKPEPGDQRERHGERHQHGGADAETDDVAERDAEAQKRHRPAQDVGAAEVESRFEARRLGEGIEHDAEYERDHHRRRGEIGLQQKPRRGGRNGQR
jgi:hypothetical protein